MLGVLSDGNWLLPFVILKRNTMLKETMPKSVIVRVNKERWVDEINTSGWLVENSVGRHTAFKQSQSVLGLGGFEGQLTEKVKHEVEKTDLVVACAGMLQLQYSLV